MGTVHDLTERKETFDPSAVKAIHAFSSGRAYQHKEHRNGSKLPQLWWVLTSQSWVGLPISFFLVEHKDGLVLFDTGLDPAIRTDPNYISQAIGRILLKRIFRFEIGPDDKLGNILKSNGFDPLEIRKAVISHLHFDHVGGIADVPQAELLVSHEEWSQLSAPHPEREWILREHIDIPEAKWRPFHFQANQVPLFGQFGETYDLMGDGSLMLLPTPGHTPGSLSMLIRSSIGPPTLLIGDLAYSQGAITQDRVPGTGDAKLLRTTYKKIRALKDLMPDILIVPSHDDEAVTTLNSVFSP